MKIAKIFIVLAFLLAFTVCISAQKRKSARNLTLNANDKAEIINQIFEVGFKKLMENSENSAFQTCLIPLVEDEKVIFISTEIEKEVVKPEFEGYRFIIMSSDEMRQQVLKEKGECYFRIYSFVISGSKVKVTFARMFNLPAYIYGIGFYYEFEKTNGKWEKQLVKNYRIVS